MKKRLLIILLAVLMLVSMVYGCGTNGGGSVSNNPVSGTCGAQQPEGTRLFTDSVDREVEIPATLDEIAPSGALAQIVLYTIAPNQMVGLASEFTKAQKEYIDEAYWSLPVFGQIYGKNVSLNTEALVAANPDIIIDIGEVKPGIAEELDSVQEQTGIPVVFIEATLETMPEAYETLGGLTGNEKKAAELGSYITDVLQKAQRNKEAIPEEERVRVYYGEGDMGLGAISAGSIHGDVIQYVGAVNVAEIEELVSGGGDEISMEQLLLWNPDVILFAPESVYDNVGENPEWQNLAAVQNDAYYEIPIGPYNWMGRPPSVNRFLGIQWLGNLLYPHLYNDDMIEVTKEFYELFYHINITDEQAQQLMAHSTYKIQE